MQCAVHPPLPGVLIGSLLLGSICGLWFGITEGVPGDCWWRGAAGWPSGHEHTLERCTLTVFAHSRHLAETWLKEEENISVCGKYPHLGSYCRGVPIMAEATKALSSMMWCQPLGWWAGWASGSWSPSTTWSLSQGQTLYLVLWPKIPGSPMPRGQ